VRAIVEFLAQVSVVAFVLMAVVMLLSPLLLRSGKLGRRSRRFLITFVEYVGNRPMER
jgi:hypothetical protein